MKRLSIARTAGYVLVAVTAAWAGLRVYSSRQSHVLAPGVSAVTVPGGEASPPSETDLLDQSQQVGPLLTRIPDLLPHFSLGDVAAKMTSIDTWRGKSLVLNFWATWCAPCRREIPLLNALQQQWAVHGVEVIGVAVDYRDKVSAYATEMHISYPLLLGEQEALDVATALGVTTPVFPFTVFTDRRGHIVALYVGELHKPQADLILGVVDALNREAVSLPDARRKIADGLQEIGTDRAT